MDTDNSVTTTLGGEIYALEGGTGEFANYDTGTLAWAIPESIIPPGLPEPDNLDRAAWISTLDLAGNINVSP